MIGNFNSPTLPGHTVLHCQIHSIINVMVNWIQKQKTEKKTSGACKMHIITHKTFSFTKIINFANKHILNKYLMHNNYGRCQLLLWQ